MSIETNPPLETNNLHPWELALAGLSWRENLLPITAKDINVVGIRDSLKEAGVNLGLSEAEKQSLRQRQFRDNLTEGRGPGMVAALGEKRVKELRQWCQGQGGPRLHYSGKPVKEGTEGRSLMQLAADIVQLAVLGPDSLNLVEDFCNGLNARVCKGMKRGQEPGEKERIDQVFVSIPEQDPTHSSVVPGSPFRLWQWLLNEEPMTLVVESEVG